MRPWFNRTSSPPKRPVLPLIANSLEPLSYFAHQRSTVTYLTRRRIPLGPNRRPIWGPTVVLGWGAPRYERGTPAQRYLAQKKASLI